MKKYLFFLVATTLCSISSLIAQESDEYLNEAYALYEEESYEEAIYVLDELLEEEEVAEGYYLRGVCKSALEQDEEALKDYTLALAIQPEYAEAFFEKAYSNYKMGNFQAAIQQYTQAIDIQEDYPQAYLNRGSVRLELEDVKGACHDWHEAEQQGLDIARELIDEYCGDIDVDSEEAERN